MHSYGAPNHLQTDELKARIEAMIEEEMKAIRNGSARDNKEFEEERKRAILVPLRDGYFFEDSIMRSHVHRLFVEIAAANSGVQMPQLVFLSRKAQPNAASYGAGILVIDLGLFRLAQSLDEVAFVLAHEMAHDNFSHVKASIEKYHDQFSVTNLKKSGLAKDLKQGDISALRQIMYGSAGFSRENEREADSAAYAWLSKTPYNPASGRRILGRLDSVSNDFMPKPPLVLREWLFYKQYPFKEKWLAPAQKSGLANDDAPVFLFHKDSISSHPHMAERLAHLDSLDRTVSRQVKEDAYPYDQKLKLYVQYETLWSALKTKDFLMGLYQLSQLMNSYPQEPLLQEILCRFFVEFYESKKEHTLGKYLPQSLDESHPLFEYNTFLNNLRLSEIAQLAYYQLTERVQFNTDDVAHYHLKMNVLQIANKQEERQKLMQEHGGRFVPGQNHNK